MDSFQVTIIGGGIVGLAIGKELSKKFKDCLILEKEKYLLSDTSSRNSEVIHSGIYYEKKSLKRSLCIHGKKLLYDDCEQNSIPHKQIGKLIISNSSRNQEIKKLLSKGKQNGLDDLIYLEKNDVINIEPDVNANYGIFSPSTGIIDSHLFGESLQKEFQENEGIVLKKTEFLKASEKNSKLQIEIRNPDNSTYKFSTKYLINCSGNSAVSNTHKIKCIDAGDVQAYPVKGNYFLYTGEHSFNHLIYPMPDKLGLGIHSTLNLENELKFGPDVDLKNVDLYVDDSNKNKFLNLIKKWWPNIVESKLQPGYAGLRPKIKINNQLYKDYKIDLYNLKDSKIINLLGIESPGLTSCLSIARYCLNLLKIDV